MTVPRKTPGRVVREPPVPESIVVVGCGGLGREVYGLISAISTMRQPSWEVEGFFDDDPSPRDRRLVSALGSQILGRVVDLASMAHPPPVVIAVGAPNTRCHIASRLPANVTYPALVHPDATVGSPTELAPGCVVAAGARLTTNIQLGSHVHVDQNVTVGHDCQLDDYVRLNPGSCISGDVRLGAGVLVGANATVLQGVRIGADVTVGAGACVVRDVDPGEVVKGVPAR